MFSMTGIGQCVLSKDNIRLEVIISSLNKKNLEVDFKSSNLSVLIEHKLRKLIKESFTRGKFTIEISPKSTSDCIGFAQSVKEDFLKMCTKLQMELDQSIFQKFLLKSFFEKKHFQIDEDLIIEAVKFAITNLKGSRQQEGLILKSFFVTKLQLINTFISKLEDNIDNYKNKLSEIIIKKSQGLSLEIDQKSVTEAKFFVLTKHDIDEEVLRLKFHIMKFMDVIDSNHCSGRMLDFIVQEILRETSTICSKAICTEISFIAIEMKNEVEKIREQVQNVE